MFSETRNQEVIESHSWNRSYRPSNPIPAQCKMSLKHPWISIRPAAAWRLPVQGSSPSPPPRQPIPLLGDGGEGFPANNLNHYCELYCMYVPFWIFHFFSDKIQRIPSRVGKEGWIKSKSDESCIRCWTFKWILKVFSFSCGNVRSLQLFIYY